MRFAVIIILAFALANCGGNESDEQAVSEIVVADSILAWQTNPDSMTMTRDKAIPDSAITINRIIGGLNQKYPEVQVNFIKQNGDTVFIEVPNSNYLGEQMGSAGALAWYADAVINITSVPGINFVSFKMDAHSHAGSTVIGREKYNDWKKQ